MLTIPSGTSEQETINRIKAARGNAEPVEPTEEPEVVDMSIDDTDEITEEAEELHTDAIEQPEEVEQVEEAVASEEDELYLDLDGEEIPLSQVKEWKSGHMMQSDYTRKTTELAEQRKEFESMQQAFNEKQNAMMSNFEILEAMIAEDELTPEQAQEMREYEPEAYIKHMEKQQKRKELLKSKPPVNTPSFDPQVEQQKLVQANPQWLDNGKPTKAYEEDTKLLNDYAQQRGVTADKFATFDATMIQIMIDAARFQKISKSNAAVEKKVRKAPVTTKPRQAVQSGIHDKIEKAKAKLKRTGSMEDAVALKKLQRQFNN